QKFKNISYSVGVDVFELYLREAQEKRTHNEYIMADINQIEFKQKSFDAVVAIDVLEHLTKKEGHALIERMENWAKKKVIIFTPNNYVEQEEYEKDIFQEHKSGWSYEELKELGFEVVGMGDWRKVREAHAIPKYKPRVL
ncbi:MAG: class I SAM-dependent methyltransferase, partial [Candidatus Thermoplasmatota archaeon]|nr:class I SAM-dependent methyltransferase [Candidatus Thermoplasmatota archaeon]